MKGLKKHALGLYSYLYNYAEVHFLISQYSIYVGKCINGDTEKKNGKMTFIQQISVSIPIKHFTSMLLYVSEARPRSDNLIYLWSRHVNRALCHCKTEGSPVWL